ncbi:MAG: type II secretion system protein [Patescibacteria group bacterium]|jgi:type IV pilus assembly protein PilA
MKRLSRGFTLIELLVVIGILAILLAITLIAINPARQFGQANNTNRRSAILQVLNAVHQYNAENAHLPPSVTAMAVTTPVLFNSTGSLGTLCSEIMSTYIPALPVDPSITGGNITDCTTAGWDTGYTIEKDAAGRITVSAPQAELSATIQVTR